MRSELGFLLRVDNDIDFDPGWVTASFSAGGSERTITGADFVGDPANVARTPRFPLPTDGEVAVHIQIGPGEGAPAWGEADISLDLEPEALWLVRIVFEARLSGSML